MHKRLSTERLLVCFMAMSIIGMGFTNHDVRATDVKETPTYIINGSLENQKIDRIAETSNLVGMLEKTVDIDLTAYVLMAGDKKVGTLKSAGEIESILEELKVEFSATEDKNIKVNNIEILEELDILKEEVRLENIEDKNEVLNYIKTGGEELGIHLIEVGESFTTIAEIYNMTIENLILLNPNKDGNNLNIADEIIIKTKKPLITIVTTREIETTKDINFETEIKEDPNMYDTKSEVKVEGQLGQLKTVTKEIKYNDKVIKKELISEEVVKESINKIVVKGTKKMPKTAASGSFTMPTRGRISSPFGGRWGRMHKGIDIAKSSGSDIVAADGGTIVFSGALGSYGNLIEIDHGNGYRTKYAHCSRLLVGVGTKVYKGQSIAKVGSTGRSTGPHLHFEVLKNGVNLNPSNFVR